MAVNVLKYKTEHVMTRIEEQAYISGVNRKKAYTRSKNGAPDFQSDLYRCSAEIRIESCLTHLVYFRSQETGTC